MSDIQKIIETSSFLGFMSEQDRSALVDAFTKKGEQRTISPGEILTCVEDPARLYFLLEKGTLLVEYADGRSFVTSTCGDLIGYRLFRNKMEYSATIIVLEEGLVHVIDRDTVNDFMKNQMLETDMLDLRTGTFTEKEMEIS